MLFTTVGFQSPRSGKFVSDCTIFIRRATCSLCFNPLDRGNLYQIGLDVYKNSTRRARVSIPYIGEICIRLGLMSIKIQLDEQEFQSPISGKFVSNWI